jgi:low temperature requirement protein LtrA
LTTPGDAPARGRKLPRDPHEAHRAATPLELLFDLCFVVAIAHAAGSLHHAVSHGHTLHALPAFGMVFFAIWWAWMNFTWHASAYDSDDVPYRLLAFVQIIGVLILAAGITRAFEGNFDVVTVGYCVMRVGLIVSWLRAGRLHPERQGVTRTYAAGLVLLQFGWIGAQFIPASWWLAAFGVLMLLELVLPVIAERAGNTPWHRHHIAERYGLLTLIVIGESVLATTMALEAAITADDGNWGSRVELMAGGALCLLSMWWIYFDQPAHRGLKTIRHGFVWGYGHYFIFGAIAAAGAGLAVLIEVAGHAAHIPHEEAGLALAVPVAVFLLAVLAVLMVPLRRSPAVMASTVAAMLVSIGAAWTHHTAIIIGVALTAVAAVCTLFPVADADDASAHA